MQILNLNIIKLYDNQFRNLTEQISNIDIIGLHQAIPIIKNYYGYLKQCGITYGAIALDVMENAPGFGRFANLHLLNEAKHYGKTLVEIARLQAEYPIRLAYHDAKLRWQSKTGIIDDNEGVENLAIMRYHIKALALYDMDSCSWGGTFFEKFAGSGSWRDLSGYDLKPQVLVLSAAMSLIKNAIVDGISARQCFQELVRTFMEEDLSPYNTGLIYHDIFGLDYGRKGVMQTAGYQVMVNRLVGVIKSEQKPESYSEKNPLDEFFGNFKKKVTDGDSPSGSQVKQEDVMTDLFASSEALANSAEFKSLVTDTVQRANDLIENPDWLSAKQKEINKIFETMNNAHENVPKDYSNIFDMAARFKNEIEKTMPVKEASNDNVELPCCLEGVLLNLIPCKPCNGYDEL